MVVNNRTLRNEMCQGDLSKNTRINKLVKKRGDFKDRVVVMTPEELQQFIERAIHRVLSGQSTLEESFKSEILILPEAAAYCRMPVPTFREYLGRKEIRGSKIGKSWRFFVEDLDEFILKYRSKTNSDIKEEIDERFSH